MNYKIWLCSITGDSEEILEKHLSDTYSYFDGLVYVLHKSKDSSKEVLEKYKGGGELIEMPWLSHNGLSYNAVLTSKKILPGDFIFWVDTMEKYQVSFLKNLRDFVII